MRADKLIFPQNIDKIQLGEIDTSSVCFNINHLNNATWNDKQYGDFNFYNQLINKNDSINKKYLNYILSKTQMNDQIGSFGL